MGKSSALQYALLTLVCAAYCSYILAFHVKVDGWVDISGSLLMMGFLLGGILGVVVFALLMMREVLQSKWHENIQILPAFALGYVLLDALYGLGRLPDKTPYLTTIVPVLAGGLIGWLVFTLRPSHAEARQEKEGTAKKPADS